MSSKDDLPLETRRLVEQIQVGCSVSMGRLDRRSGIRSTARQVRELEDMGLIQRVGPILSRAQRARRRRWRA